MVFHIRIIHADSTLETVGISAQGYRSVKRLFPYLNIYRELVIKIFLKTEYLSFNFRRKNILDISEKLVQGHILNTYICKK